MNEVIPVVLFAYSRPALLSRTLETLRANKVPLIYAYSDGARTPDKQTLVSQVRQILHGIDWCDVVLCEREQNLGLGRSILTGVDHLFTKHDSLIVFEDDLICVPGTYDYLVAALRQYADDSRVSSVTGWTHPRVIPGIVTDEPYFDGRAECWVWGTWARVWRGMDRDALTLMHGCEASGIDPYRYGADLPQMAPVEVEKNIWAVRFLYLHILNGSLCVRPPWSMVEHIGWGEAATNASNDLGWKNAPLRECPPIPAGWSVPTENPECPRLWQTAYGSRPTWLARAKSNARLVYSPLWCRFLERVK